MLNVYTPKQAKQAARSLERFLEAKGFTLKHGEALDALGQLTGQKNWAALSQLLTEEGVNAELSDFEIAHAHDSVDSELRLDETGGTGFGEEGALSVHTGFQLRYPAIGEELDYVRICDPLGREIVYWSCDEWKEDPSDIIGAIIGALGRGRPHVLHQKDRLKELNALDDMQEKAQGSQKPSANQALRAASAATAAKPKLTVHDIPWKDVTAMLVNAQHFDVRFADMEEIEKLKRAPAPEEDVLDEDLEWQTAVTLGDDDEGLVTEVEVSLATLRRLAWYDEIKCFVDPSNGDTYQVILAKVFGE